MLDEGPAAVDKRLSPPTTDVHATVCYFSDFRLARSPTHGGPPRLREKLLLLGTMVRNFPSAACRANQSSVEALVAESRRQQQNPRVKQGLQRAVRSLCAASQAITTIEAAQALDGVGAAIAVKIIRACTTHEQGVREAQPRVVVEQDDSDEEMQLCLSPTSTTSSMEVSPVKSSRWRAVLLLDAREKRKVEMESSLLQLGVACEQRQVLNQLNHAHFKKQVVLGDMVWIVREEDSGEERVLPYCVVERKTQRDLARSIVDGRYVEQRRRLQALGLTGCYLVEGNLSDQ